MEGAVGVVIVLYLVGKTSEVSGENSGESLSHKLSHAYRVLLASVIGVVA